MKVFYLRCSGIILITFPKGAAKVGFYPQKQTTALKWLLIFFEVDNYEMKNARESGAAGVYK